MKDLRKKCRFLLLKRINGHITGSNKTMQTKGFYSSLQQDVSKMNKKWVCWEESPKYERKFSKKIETLKTNRTNQTEVLEITKTTGQIKTTLENIPNRQAHKERMSLMKNKADKITHSNKHKRKKYWIQPIPPRSLRYNQKTKLENPGRRKLR